MLGTLAAAAAAAATAAAFGMDVARDDIDLGIRSLALAGSTVVIGVPTATPSMKAKRFKTCARNLFF